MVGGGFCTWSMTRIGSGSISVAGLSVGVRSVVDNLSCLPGHSRLGRRVLSGAGREMVYGDGICAGESEVMVASFSSTQGLVHKLGERAVILPQHLAKESVHPALVELFQSLIVPACFIVELPKALHIFLRHLASLEENSPPLFRFWLVLLSQIWSLPRCKDKNRQ